MLQPRKEDRPTTEQLLQFEFFARANNPMKKSKSMNMLYADSKVSIKDLEELRVKLAKLKNANRTLQVKNAELQAELNKRNEKDLIQKIEALKAQFKKEKERVKDLEKIRAGLEQDLDFAKRETREVEKKNLILQKSLGKGEAVLQNMKKLNKYLFKTSQVIFFFQFLNLKISKIKTKISKK